MKNGKRLTVAERKHFEKITKLSSENWLISKKTSWEWTFIHRLVRQVRKIPAP